MNLRSVRPGDIVLIGPRLDYRRRRQQLAEATLPLDLEDGAA